MGRTEAARPQLPLARLAGRNIKHLRQRKGMSIGALAERTRTAGHHVNTAALSDIERGYTGRGIPKAITVDQLQTIATVLGVQIETLLRRPDCLVCRDTPPPGMTCNACSAGQPTGLPQLPCRKTQRHESHLWLHDGRAHECTGTPNESPSASRPQNTPKTGRSGA